MSQGDLSVRSFLLVRDPDPNGGLQDKPGTSRQTGRARMHLGPRTRNPWGRALRPTRRSCHLRPWAVQAPSVGDRLDFMFRGDFLSITGPYTVRLPCMVCKGKSKRKATVRLGPDLRGPRGHLLEAAVSGLRRTWIRNRVGRLLREGFLPKRRLFLGHCSEDTTAGDATSTPHLETRRKARRGST